MDLRRLLLSRRSNTKLPRLLLSHPKSQLPDLKVICESPCEDADQVELRMANRRLMLVGGNVALSLSDFIDQQFSPRPRLSLLKSAEKKRRVTCPSKSLRRRLRL